MPTEGKRFVVVRPNKDDLVLQRETSIGALSMISPHEREAAERFMDSCVVGNYFWIVRITDSSGYSCRGLLFRTR